MVNVSLDSNILNDFGWQYIDNGAIATGQLLQVYGAEDQVPGQATLIVVRIAGGSDDDQDLVMLQFEEDLLPDYGDDGQVEFSVNVDEEVRCFLKAVRLNRAHVPIFNTSKYLLSMLKVAKKLDVFAHVNNGTAVAAQFKFPQALKWGEIRFVD